MAPQLKGIDDETEDLQTSTTEELRTHTGKPFARKPYPMATTVIPEVSSLDNPWSHPNGPPNMGRPTGLPSRITIDFTVSSSSLEWITTTKATPLGESVKSSPLTTYSPFLVSTGASLAPSHTSYGYGHGPDWHGVQEKMNNRKMLAAAAVPPVVILILIGALVFFCVRKRKRHQQGVVATQRKAQEMKMQPHFHTTAQPYIAPVPAVALSYAASSSHLMPPPNPSAPPPIILGPIPSGANGAYFTGIDTSDVISMTSASNLRPGPPNPFSDNDSLAEPPPPYRPRSAAPPSLTNSSRHSSFRASVAPPATSRTHLIERSPFEDPDDGDAVSELSGPTTGHGEDAMSTVSDLSYQNDPVVNSSSL